MQIQGIGAVVTGGGSGLGEATARLLASKGAKVAILDLGRSKGAEVAKSLGGDAIFCETDVASEEQVTAALDEAVGRFGGIHAAVNCAGIGTAGRTVDKNGKPFDLKLFELTLRVNLLGTFNVIRLAAARMMQNPPNDENERGVVVNTASAAAFEGQIGQCAYSASKGGVVGMTLPIARDLASIGVRVNTIAPGLFGTPMLMMMPQEARDDLASQIPFPRRLGKPPEFAALACHIIENPMINGETIRIDGAIRMQPK
ncbi:MAG: 3-hydroxyacyl-CoA dehydrogenase [Proteobacteria bacterium]|nr:MAG: 3-hydroxyacyl-CoA dehydrogenase [Pseudomonadota bacterium]